MAEATMSVPDIKCEGCASSIRRTLGKLGGIGSVAVDVAERTVAVQYDGEVVTVDQIAARLAQAGFPVSGV